MNTPTLPLDRGFPLSLGEACPPVQSEEGLQLKRCSSCGQHLCRSQFCADRSNLDGLRHECRACRAKSYYANADKNRQRSSRYYSLCYAGVIRDNPDRFRKAWRDSYRRRYSEDLQFRLRQVLRSRLRSAFRVRGIRRGASAVRDLGCTVDELRVHLESLFLPGMSWENYGRGRRGELRWEVDHIVPLSSFDLGDREQLLAAVHFTNLQPLWALDNNRKRAKSKAEETK